MNVENPQEATRKERPADLREAILQLKKRKER